MVEVFNHTACFLGLRLLSGARVSLRNNDLKYDKHKQLGGYPHALLISIPVGGPSPNFFGFGIHMMAFVEAAFLLVPKGLAEFFDFFRSGV